MSSDKFNIILYDDDMRNELQKICKGLDLNKLRLNVQNRSS